MLNKLSANDIDYIEKFAEIYGMEYSGYSTINDFATYISVEDNTTKDYGIFITDIRFAVGTKVDKQILIKYFSDIKIDSNYVCLENYIKKNELKPIKNKEIMNELKITYENAINSYIKEFEKVHEIDFDSWVGDAVGEVAQFGDYYFNFSEIKLSIDEKIDFETISEWYWYCVDNPKNLYNLKTFAKLKSDFWSARKFLKVEFTKHEKKLMFENELLKLSLRSYENTK